MLLLTLAMLLLLLALLLTLAVRRWRRRCVRNAAETAAAAVAAASVAARDVLLCFTRSFFTALLRSIRRRCVFAFTIAGNNLRGRQQVEGKATIRWEGNNSLSWALGAPVVTCKTATPNETSMGARCGCHCGCHHEWWPIKWRPHGKLTANTACKKCRS